MPVFYARMILSIYHAIDAQLLITYCVFDKQLRNFELTEWLARFPLLLVCFEFLVVSQICNLV